MLLLSTFRGWGHRGTEMVGTEMFPWDPTVMSAGIQLSQLIPESPTAFLETQLVFVCWKHGKMILNIIAEN